MSKFAGLALATAVTARMTITHPITGQPLRNSETGAEAYLELLSKDSPVARAHDRQMLDKQLKRQGRRVTADEVEANRVERLAKLTKGWSLVTLDGAPLEVPFSDAAAREFYAVPEMIWLRDQAADFVDDLGNFPAPPSLTSSTTPDTSST